MKFWNGLDERTTIGKAHGLALKSLSYRRFDVMEVGAFKAYFFGDSAMMTFYIGTTNAGSDDLIASERLMQPDANLTITEFMDKVLSASANYIIDQTKHLNKRLDKLVELRGVLNASVVE